MMWANIRVYTEPVDRLCRGCSELLDPPKDDMLTCVLTCLLTCVDVCVDMCTCFEVLVEVDQADFNFLRRVSALAHGTASEHVLEAISRGRQRAAAATDIAALRHYGRAYHLWPLSDSGGYLAVEFAGGEFSPGSWLLCPQMGLDHLQPFYETALRKSAFVAKASC